MMSRVTISITPELDAALDIAAYERNINKSRLVEILLREHAALQPVIDEVRSESRFTAYAASSRVRSRRAKAATASSASE